MPDPGQLLPIADVYLVEEWWVQIIKAIVLFAVAMMIAPVLVLVERKLLGRFQARYGPNRVGPYGTMQPLADVIKLVAKEQSRPRTSVGRGRPRPPSRLPPRPSPTPITST